MDLPGWDPHVQVKWPKKTWYSHEQLQKKYLININNTKLTKWTLSHQVSRTRVVLDCSLMEKWIGSQRGWWPQTARCSQNPESTPANQASLKSDLVLNTAPHASIKGITALPATNANTTHSFLFLSTPEAAKERAMVTHQQACKPFHHLFRPIATIGYGA